MTDRPFYICGDGGLGWELLDWLKAEQHLLLDRFSGFLITDGAARVRDQVPTTPLESVVGVFDYLLAVGSARDRLRLAEVLSGSRGEPVTFISKRAVVSDYAVIGQGIVVNPFCSISARAEIRDFALINCHSGVGHDAVIGRSSVLLGHNAVNGNARIGECVTVGAGAVIHPGRTVDDNASVGMAAAVFRNVQSGTVVVGNPARQIGRRN